jgi:hypothetical protein
VRVLSVVDKWMHVTRQSSGHESVLLDGTTSSPPLRSQEKTTCNWLLSSSRLEP